MNIEVVKKLIKKHVPYHSDVISKSIISERYYKNKNDILFKSSNRQEEETENPLRNADNRISSSFYSLLVNQKASYLFTYPPTFDVSNNKTNKAITEVLGDIYPKICKDLCINASNSGASWLHLWKDKDSKLSYGVVDSKQVIPLWSSDLNKKLIGVLRVYDEIDENGDNYIIYEYWTDTECQAYRKLDDLDIDELEAYNMFSITYGNGDILDKNNTFKHDFGELPFIPFFNNNIKTSDLDTVKSLIDTYDKVFSGFVNDLEDIQEIIFILTNYGGTDLKSFLEDMKKYKTVEVESNGMDDKSGLSTLTIDIPVEAREKLLMMTRKAIFEQGQGVDPQPTDFGNASGVALKYLYSLLELKAGLMETEFKLSFGKLIRMICKSLNLECNIVNQTWTRNAIANDLELAEICAKSVGIVSDKTVCKNSPIVEDVEYEIAQIKKEKEEVQREYDDLIPNDGVIDET
ncbi:TPA: phage portal protein [Clostridioides difficile]|nr:phage portal protein [Clostridioides difficile]